MGFASIDDYINSLDESGKRSVHEFIAFMKSEFPKLPTLDIFSPTGRLELRKEFKGAILLAAFSRGKITLQQFFDRLDKLALMAPKTQRR